MNVVFISHCDFEGNSAMHIYSIANVLESSGVRCAVCVPNDASTIALHGAPKFEVVPYADAYTGPVFPDGAIPDIIHAWTPREVVRKLTERLVGAHKCPYIVHLEDNEEIILENELEGLTYDQLRHLPPQAMDSMVPDHRSHPVRYKEFLANAAGVTVLMDRLLEFKPPNSPGLVFWPGFEEDFLNPPAATAELRRGYGVTEGEIVLVYCGNIHETNAGEVRSLFLAVRALRRSGRPVTILKTGRNYVADNSWIQEAVESRAVIDLGFLPRAQMRSVLAMADILVQPGKSDRFNDYRFPSKLPEFLASGKPVILPRTNLGLAVRDGVEALLLEYGDAIEIAEKIELLIADPALAARLGAAGKQFAMRRLMWSKNVPPLKEFYAQIIAMSARYAGKSDDLEAIEVEHRTPIRSDRSSLAPASGQDAQEEPSRLRDEVHSQAMRIRQLESQVLQIGSLAEQNQEALRRIVESRIWRALVTAGGLLLRIAGKSGARSSPNDLAAAKTVPAGDMHFLAPQLGSATTYASSEQSIDDRIEVLRTASTRRNRLVPDEPIISIITPARNISLGIFAQTALSVLEQTHPGWEWIIVDDCSDDRSSERIFEVLQSVPGIRVIRLPARSGVSFATNAALDLATADFVCFLEQDDLLTTDAVSALQRNMNAEVDAIYSDSDEVNQAGEGFEPFYKPDWSPEYFRGVMYIGHLLCVRRELANQIQRFNPVFDGVQDYEFMLRLSEATSRIRHVPSILYHGRALSDSLAATSQANTRLAELQLLAVQASLDRHGLSAKAVMAKVASPNRVRVCPLRQKSYPAVSILIPTKDAGDLLERCLATVFEKSTYPSFEVICADNDTTCPRALAAMRTFPVRRILVPGKFNYSRVNNLAASVAHGEFLVFLNNDIEVIAAEWLEEMLYYAQQPDVGAVGALLLYPDHTIQHAGVVLGCRGTADHMLRRAPTSEERFPGSLSVAREVSGVTAACMMLGRQRFEQAGRFSEHFSTAYQDVELCLQLRTMGLRNIVTPYARLIHHESVSRGSFYDHADRNLLLERWQGVISQGDPYYNPNLNLEKCDYSPAVPPT